MIELLGAGVGGAWVMFGFGVRVMEAGSRLVVVDPFNYLVLLVVPVVGWAMWLSFREKGKWRVKAVLMLLLLGFAVSAERLTLDGRAGTATLEEFRFFHWSKVTMPLRDLVGARVRTGRGSSAVQLQFADGHVHAMSAMNQEGGKEVAVYAINRFVGAGFGR